MFTQIYLYESQLQLQEVPFPPFPTLLYKSSALLGMQTAQLGRSVSAAPAQKYVRVRNKHQTHGYHFRKPDTI